MREIKFRVYLDKMYYQNEYVEYDTNLADIDFLNKTVTFAAYTDGEEVDNLEKYSFDENDILYKKDLKIMQYTGLKDKNNKEIYEGDIVKFKDCSIDGTKEFYNIGVIEREGKRDELVISQLIFEKSYFTENYMDFINETFELSEIIGNIYENPELLKEKEVR